MQHLLTISLLTLLTSCVSMPLNGQFNNGKDSFKGTVSGSLKDSGQLSFITKSGTVCEGNYQFADSRKTGTGSFTCLDKTTGTFTLTSDAMLGTKGQGKGITNKNDRFTFTFGD